MKTIGDRTRKAQQDLVLVIRALKTTLSSSGPFSDVMDEEVVEAAIERLQDAHEELFWLVRLDAEVLALNSPDDDDRNAMEAAAIAGGAR